MRIAFVTTMAAVPWGGSEELWAQAAQTALAEGHQVLLLVPEHQPRPEKISALSDNGALVFSWNEFNTHPEENLKRQRPLAFPFQPLLDWRADVVVVSHGGLLDLVNGHILLAHVLLEYRLPYFVIVQANTELYKPDDRQRPTLRAYFNGAQRLFFVSDANRRLAERQLTSALPNATVIANPMNLTNYAPVAFPQLGSDDTVHFAGVGRLEVYCKGQEVLFDALSHPQWRERRWKLTLYGTGPDEQYLKELSAHYGLDDRVVFAGSVSDVRAIWAANHLLLLPSRLEGTPLVLMEAMVCGRSAVVTDVGGSAEWIHDNESGFVAKAPTPELLSEALERAWSRRFEWEALGRRCRSELLARHEIFTGRSLCREVLKTPPRKVAVPPPPVGGMKPRVSVIMPCYNLAAYLPEALESVLYQTFSDYEIIVVNPSSPDNTAEVVKHFQDRYREHKIRLLNIDNYGQPAYSRNLGIEQAEGEYILCLDADDFIAPTLLEKAVDALTLYPQAGLAFSNFQCFGKKSVVEYCGPFSLPDLALKNTVPTCSLFRRSLWRAVGGYRTNCAGFEDWDFWLSCYEKGCIGVAIPDILFYYRVRKDSYLADANTREDKLRAQIVLNHPDIFSESWQEQARAVLPANS